MLLCQEQKSWVLIPIFSQRNRKIVDLHHRKGEKARIATACHCDNFRVYFFQELSRLTNFKTFNSKTR